MTSVHISSGLALQRQNDVCSHQPRSLKEKKNVHFSASFLDQEEKSSFYPNDFPSMILQKIICVFHDTKILSTAVNLWIGNLVIRKRVEDFQLGIESYQTQLNLTKPRWETTGLEFMHDYKILDSPRAVLFRDKYGMQMLMRFNEIRLNTRFWTTNDVIKFKQFMFAIQKRLKLRRIFRNLESFIGGRIREGDYRLLQRTE
ncbi:hypothetical protein Tco_0023840 [Tanacetum coccineum]